MAVKELKEQGRYKGTRDAKKPFRFFIKPRHAVLAKRRNESWCVVAQGASEAHPNDIVVSIGPSVSKILDRESGHITRYGTPSRLKDGLSHFDKTGNWGLPPGDYALTVPSGAVKLKGNQTPEQKKQGERRWEAFVQRLKRGKTKRNGIQTHKSRPLHARNITIHHAPRRKKRAK
jgi:hypothetical protein